MCVCVRACMRACVYHYQAPWRATALGLRLATGISPPRAASTRGEEGAERYLIHKFLLAIHRRPGYEATTGLAPPPSPHPLHPLPTFISSSPPGWLPILNLSSDVSPWMSSTVRLRWPSMSGESNWPSCCSYIL